MSNYICKKAWVYNQIKPRYDMVIKNSANDYEEPLLLIIDRYNDKAYRFTPQMIIGMAKKERLGLFDGD